MVNHALIRSWNQQVLSNAGNVYCSRKQHEFILIFLCVISCVLFCKRMWYPLSATWVPPFVFGCSLRTGNVILNFIREESSFVVLLIMLLSSSFVFMLFYTTAISSATSLICFILFILIQRRLSSCVSFQNSETAFTSPIFFPQPLINLQIFLSCSVLLYSLSMFRRYCKYKSNLKNSYLD